MDKWIDITSCEDGADRVLLHEKTGQRKTVKPSERTVLDDAYDRFWNHPSSNPPTDVLLAAVRDFTLKVSKRDEDIAQDVVLTVFERLDSFRLADETAFTRWVRAIVKRVRLEAYRTSSDHTDEYVEAAIEPPSEESYADISKLPRDFNRIAGLLISGYSLDEIATSFKITTPALRKEMQRYREKYCHKK